jgi:Protein of unknown function (DUF3304)
MISSNKAPREGKDQAGPALKRYLAPMLWLAVGIPVTLMGCAQAHAPATDTAPPPTGAHLSMDAKSLLIQGYNYTDDYIDSFTVDGQGGGNLYVSGPNSGGGKSVCCSSFSRGTPLPVKLKVRWMGAYCMEYETNMFGRTSAYRKGLWKEAEALTVDLSRGKPRALEVHIFPDGHVEAAITQGYSPPRMVLPRTEKYQRPGTPKTYPDCTDDQLKQATQ